jgi:uncharacterized protein YndB with AHSA1/START domain
MPTTAAGTDRIEKEIVMKAPRARVWRALTDSAEFGKWFGVSMEDPFVPGRRARGRITIRGYENLTLEVVVERMEAERVFSWRWHPYAVDPAADYSAEPMTLVECELFEVPEGTRLRIVESGFDAIPLARRAEAFRMNSQGWTGQMKNIARYLGESA